MEDLPGQSIPGTHHVTEQENHITLVAEPGSTFVGHVTAVGSSAADEARAIIGGLNERGVATGGIRAADLHLHTYVNLLNWLTLLQPSFRRVNF